MAKLEFRDEQELFRFVMQAAKLDWYEEESELTIHIKEGEKMTITIKPPKSKGLAMPCNDNKMQVTVK